MISFQLLNVRSGKRQPLSALSNARAEPYLRYPPFRCISTLAFSLPLLSIILHHRPCRITRQDNSFAPLPYRSSITDRLITAAASQCYSASYLYHEFGTRPSPRIHTTCCSSAPPVPDRKLVSHTFANVSITEQIRMYGAMSLEAP